MKLFKLDIARRSSNILLKRIEPITREHGFIHPINVKRSFFPDTLVGRPRVTCINMY